MLKFTLDCFASLAKTIHKKDIVIASRHCCAAKATIPLSTERPAASAMVNSSVVASEAKQSR